jgi:hypothetical protein
MPASSTSPNAICQLLALRAQPQRYDAPASLLQMVRHSKLYKSTAKVVPARKAVNRNPMKVRPPLAAAAAAAACLAAWTAFTAAVASLAAGAAAPLAGGSWRGQVPPLPVPSHFYGRALAADLSWDNGASFAATGPWWGPDGQDHLHPTKLANLAHMAGFTAAGPLGLIFTLCPCCRTAPRARSPSP